MMPHVAERGCSDSDHAWRCLCDVDTKNECRLTIFVKCVLALPACGLVLCEDRCALPGLVLARLMMLP